VNKAKAKPRSWLTMPTNAGDEKFPWKVGCEEQERGKSFKALLRLSVTEYQAYREYKHSLTLADISRSGYVVKATKPVHQLQILPIVHN